LETNCSFVGASKHNFLSHSDRFPVKTGARRLGFTAPELMSSDKRRTANQHSWSEAQKKHAETAEQAQLIIEWFTD
jgi:hypothetical protein